MGWPFFPNPGLAIGSLIGFVGLFVGDSFRASSALMGTTLGGRGGGGGNSSASPSCGSIMRGQKELSANARGKNDD